MKCGEFDPKNSCEICGRSLNINYAAKREMNKKNYNGYCCMSTHGGSGYGLSDYLCGEDMICTFCGARIVNPNSTGGYIFGDYCIPNYGTQMKKQDALNKDILIEYSEKLDGNVGIIALLFLISAIVLTILLNKVAILPAAVLLFTIFFGDKINNHILTKKASSILPKEYLRYEKRNNKIYEGA